MLSKSYIASRSDEEKEQLVNKLKQLQALPNRNEEWIDEEVSDAGVRIEARAKKSIAD